MEIRELRTLRNSGELSKANNISRLQAQGKINKYLHNGKVAYDEEELTEYMLNGEHRRGVKYKIQKENK